MTRLSDVHVTASTDQALADIMDRISARLHQGERIELDALLAEYPEHVERLRQLWPTLKLLANASQSNGKPADWSNSESGIDELCAQPLGDFRLIREVGRGGMGIVYEAEQLSLGRRVALKVLPFAATMNSKQLQRFRNEAMAAASLRHDHIVHVYGVGCERSVHFYAMELIEGQSLAQVVAKLCADEESPQPSSFSVSAKREGRATAPIAGISTKRDNSHFRRIAELIADAARALEYAHSMGVIHRDIKPANMMLDDAGHLWITDFGLAKFNT